MKGYDKYKDSKVAWLGQIPEHWDELFLFQCAEERKVSNKGMVNQNLLSLSYGNIIRKRIDSTSGLLPASFETYQIVDEGNIIMRLTDLQNDKRSLRTGLVKEQGIITSAYVCLQCKSSIKPKYFHYLLLSFDIKKLFYSLGGGLRQGCNYTDLKKVIITKPSIGEQEQIVRYLDWKVLMADKFIKEKRREIELLKELRQAEINRAVTRGLDPNTHTKPSGIDWIGDIPEHWRCQTMRNILIPFSEKKHPNKQLLSVVREQGVIVRNCESKEENHNFIPDDLSGYKLVKTGQFVINKMKAWQGSYGVSFFEGIVSPAYFVFDLDTNINPLFFNISIRSKVYVPFFAQYSDGIRVGQWDLSPQKLKQIPIFVPTLKEQQQIVEHIKVVEQNINRAIEKIENEITLTAEYKTRLISDVTTGKVDVRNIEIPEYQVEDIAITDNEEETEE